jgi:hypothetical protein
MIVLACPSTAINGMMFTSHGKAYEYFSLLCLKGGSPSDFEDACRGGTIADVAQKVARETAKGGRRKDELRQTNAIKIRQAISKYISSYICSLQCN